MAFAVSSEDIPLAQSFLRLLDQRYGGKARGFLVVVAGAIPTILLALNWILGHMDIFPPTGLTTFITTSTVGLITLLGKFTPFFNAVIAPPAKEGAAVSISTATPPVLEPVAPVEPVEPIQQLQLPPPPPAAPQIIPVPAGNVPKPVPVAVPVE